MKKDVKINSFKGRQAPGKRGSPDAGGGLKISSYGSMQRAAWYDHGVGPASKTRTGLRFWGTPSQSPGQTYLKSNGKAGGTAND